MIIYLRLLALLTLFVIISCAGASVQKGNLALSDGNYSDAIRHYDEAVKSDNLPSNALQTAYFNRGRAKHEINDFDGAIADYNKALEINPKIVGAYINRGYAKYQKKDFYGAIADATKAIELSPNDTLAYQDRGRAKRKKGDFDGAIADFTKAIEIKPNDSTAYNNRGLAKYEKHDFDGAITDYSRAIELKPTDNTYSNRGMAMFVKDDFEKAASDFDRSLNINPDQHYTPLWLFLARERNKKDGKTGLQEHAKKYILNDDWPAQFYKLYLGEITPEDCIRIAVHQDVQQDKEKKCETYFFLGQYFILKGERTKAKEYLKKSVETELNTFGTYLVADYELRKLGRNN